MLRFYERLTDFHLIQCFVRETPLQKDAAITSGCISLLRH